MVIPNINELSELLNKTSAANKALKDVLVKKGVLTDFEFYSLYEDYYKQIEEANAFKDVLKEYYKPK